MRHTLVTMQHEWQFLLTTSPASHQHKIVQIDNFSPSCSICAAEWKPSSGREAQMKAQYGVQLCWGKTFFHPFDVNENSFLRRRPTIQKFVTGRRIFYAAPWRILQGNLGRGIALAKSASKKIVMLRQFYRIMVINHKSKINGRYWMKNVH